MTSIKGSMGVTIEEMFSLAEKVTKWKDISRVGPYYNDYMGEVEGVAVVLKKRGKFFTFWDDHMYQIMVQYEGINIGFYEEYGEKNTSRIYQLHRKAGELIKIEKEKQNEEQGKKELILKLEGIKKAREISNN